MKFFSKKESISNIIKNCLPKRSKDMTRNPRQCGMDLAYIAQDLGDEGHKYIEDCISRIMSYATVKKEDTYSYGYSGIDLRLDIYDILKHFYKDKFIKEIV